MSNRFRVVLFGSSACLLLYCQLTAADYVKKDTWRETLVASFASGPLKAVERTRNDFAEDRIAVEVVGDWLRQDGGTERIDAKVIAKVVDDLGPAGEKFRSQLDSLVKANAAADDTRWAELYLSACEARRAARLQPHRDKLRRVVFTKHRLMGGSHYAYTEGQSDAQAERHFHAGSALCMLEMDGIHAKIRTLIDDPKGVIRDPDVSYDGKRVLFAWKQDDRKDDYHLYEMDVEKDDIRQLTFGLGLPTTKGSICPTGISSSIRPVAYRPSIAGGPR